MTLVYQSPLDYGRLDFALRRDGRWYERYSGVGRNKKKFTSPTVWKPVADDLALELTKAIDPDSPPYFVRIATFKLWRSRQVNVRLPW
jgi:hypothetical protein